MEIEMQRISLEEIIEEGKMCRDWEHGMLIESCSAYNMKICPMVCTYSQKMSTQKKNVSSLNSPYRE